MIVLCFQLLSSGFNSQLVSGVTKIHQILITEQRDNGLMPKTMSAGAMPHTPLGSSQRSPDSVAGLREPLRDRMGMKSSWRMGGKD